LSGTKHILKDQATKARFALPVKALENDPYLYSQHLATIPQLPAPEKSPLPASTHPALPDADVQSAVSESVNALDFAQPGQITPQAQFPTVWGPLSFEQLYAQTYNYAAHILFYDSRYPQASLDDGLQMGYLKLWKRLQTDPDLLSERRIGWIGRFIFNGALHTQQKEWRVQKRQAGIKEPTSNDVSEMFERQILRSRTQRPHSHESRQADIRMDLHSAIASVATSILALPAGKEQDRQLWALYGITALQIQVTEMSKLFGVHHRAMKRAYGSVQQLLQDKLQGYAPRQPTIPIHNKGQKQQPFQDISLVRQQNQALSLAQYQEVRAELYKLCPDTLDRDILALDGIEHNIPAREQARNSKISPSSMQRAYERIHLLLAATNNPHITPRRPEKKRSQAFNFKPEYEPLIQLLANELTVLPNGQAQLVALYSYLCNLPNRTIAKSFGMNEATLRRYRYNIQERFRALIH
jgi:hypothetical protein